VFSVKSTIRFITVFVVLSFVATSFTPYGISVSAQQTSPATSSPSTDDLPECPEVVNAEPPNTVIDPFAPPASCKMKTTTDDLREWLAQGHTLSELGLGGDVVTVEETIEEASQEANAIAPVLYLPYLAEPGARRSSTSTLEPTISPSTSSTSTSDDPLADIPFCPDYFYTQVAETGAPKPDAPRCKARTMIDDLEELMAQGYTLQELGLGADPPVPADIGEDR
jgi:hypothetical protein